MTSGLATARPLDGPADTLTSRSQRIASASGRALDALRELSARLVLASAEPMKAALAPTPPDPSHAQACAELTEHRLMQIEELLASLLSRV